MKKIEDFYRPKDPLFIGIAGLIAAGKTTLAEELSNIMDLPLYKEPAGENDDYPNPYLKDFYKDPKKYGTIMQFYLLKERYKQNQQIIWGNKGAIQDRTIYEDKIFASLLYNSGLMTILDYETYIDMFKIMSNQMKNNTLIIYLKVDPQTSLKRVKIRNRNEEVGLKLNYLENLYEHYNCFIKEISKSIPIIEVDWNKFKNVKEMAKHIKYTYEKMYNIKKI